MKWKLVKAALVLFAAGGGVGLIGMLVGTGLAEVLSLAFGG
ncbi:hypothetical protein U5817_09800 [Aromatoleum evansii]|uniref:Uncharacterized protein n=1 Tax=Aromatoleum evansii TaxID=59406 RepID=A0ABZ1AU17_AROEV|nr:hypothetical protein U5817_09450 [Aromatoleum evansii]WRL48319.1 hypothetical protein U5817_09800 [Aromatoleum evansii]